MAFDAFWSGIGRNVGVIRITGDDARYRISWGDGQSEVARKDRDDDGDGMPDSANPLHAYGQDGTYDIEVKQLGAGQPPMRLKAFMYGSATNDLDIGGSFLADIMVGGSGKDNFRGAGGRDTLGGADGDDRLSGQAGDDFLLGGHGSDTLLGGAGSDLLGGDVGDDILHGGEDRDFVYGDAGADRLFGDNGDDYLEGGAGVDRLVGGAGADTFELAPPRDENNQPLSSDPDRDQIIDFQQGTDHLSVDQWFAGGDFSFIGTDRFTGAGEEVRYQQLNGSTFVFGDVDGDKVADFSARLEGTFQLSEADFGVF